MSDSEEISSSQTQGVKKSKNPATNVSSAIKQAEVEIRKQYPFLNYQDTCGTVVFLGSLIVIACCWVLYWKNPNSYYHCALVILLVGIFTSFLHELEHDLIHNLYYKKAPIIQDIMFFFIWVSKLHGNPWYRREMHLKHHIVSGQTDDAEERLIGLGLPFSFRRLAVSLHPFSMLIETNKVAKDATWLNVKKMNLSSAPVAWIFFTLNKLWYVYVLAMLFLGDNWTNYLPERHWWWIRWTNVCICLPNLIRQACLQTMSNCSHYYGDIPEKSVFYQNQILDHWIVYPLQLLCMNFGATHIVHHYIPGQPFYIRELVYHRVKNYMVEQGVRINDFGSIFRSNHYFNQPIMVKDISSLPAEGAEKDKMVAPNNSGVSLMAVWLAMLSVVGTLTFVVYDQWAFYCMAERMVMKYVMGKKDSYKPKEKSV